MANGIHQGGEGGEGCIFCRDSIRDNGFVLHDGSHAFIILNRYPYITGHLMVAPHRHVHNIEELRLEEHCEMFDLTARCVKVLKESLNPQGFNLGMNLGRAAGAGVEDHLHMHIVPRWVGDTQCPFRLRGGEDHLRRPHENERVAPAAFQEIRGGGQTMRFIYLIVILAFAFFFVTFGVQNSDPIKLRYFGYAYDEIPVYFLVFVFFVIGFVMAALLGAIDKLRMTLRMNKLYKKIDDLEQKNLHCSEAAPPISRPRPSRRG